MKIKIEFNQKEFDAFKGFHDMIEGKVNMISKLFGVRNAEKAKAVAGAAVESFEKTAQDGQYSIAVSIREDWVCKVTGLIKDVYEDTFDLIASIVQGLLWLILHRPLFIVVKLILFIEGLLLWLRK